MKIETGTLANLIVTALNSEYKLVNITEVEAHVYEEAGTLRVVKLNDTCYLVNTNKDDDTCQSFDNEDDCLSAYKQAVVEYEHNEEDESE